MSNPYTPFLRWIDGQQEAMEKLLIDWSDTNSGSYNLAGLARMRRTLADSFGALGGAIEEIELAPATVVDARGEPVPVALGKALSIVKRPEAQNRIFLCGHMDTVFAADHPFQTACRLDANTINGPGAADLKGGLAVMLTALKALEKSPWAEKIGWEILLNPDEEIGSPGSAPLLAQAAARNRLGLIYEPALADGTLAGARKGSGNFTVVVRGKAAHAGREHSLGRNAIVALAKFVTAIDTLNGRRPGLTVNPGKIEGGGPVNVVPDLAILRFNVRVATLEEQRWFEQQLEQICGRIEQREGFSLRLHGGFGRPPKPLDLANLKLFEAIAACGEELRIPVQWQATGGCCDGNNLAAAGLPNVDTLGVRGGKIHSSEEFVLLDSLTERARLSALFLMRLAAGDFSEL